MEDDDTFLQTLPVEVRNEIARIINMHDMRILRVEGRAPTRRDYAEIVEDIRKKVVKKLAPRHSRRNQRLIAKLLFYETLDKWEKKQRSRKSN